jgi:branched-chain amino acid transport system permease protein
MGYFLQQLINGLTLGMIYGLIAIGYTMVYGIVGMINFAHGEIFMIGAFISLITFLALGLIGLGWVPLALFIVLVATLLLTSVYGWALERVAYRPLRRSPRLAALITAIGMSIFLQNYVQLLQGARVKPLQPVITGGARFFEGGEFAVNFSFLQMLIILVTLGLMLGFTLLINRTALGRAQRACQQDLGMAALVGIDVDRTIALTFVLGASLASVAGLMFAWTLTLCCTAEDCPRFCAATLMPPVLPKDVLISLLALWLDPFHAPTSVALSATVEPNRLVLTTLVPSVTPLSISAVPPLLAAAAS